MKTVEDLRPEIRPLEADWSAATLEDIFASTPRRTPSRSRRRLVVAGATVGGVLAVGGVAYAGGLIPSLVSTELDWISPSSVSDVREIATFTAETDGKTRTFEIWRGTNTDGQSCTAVLEAQGDLGPNFGGYCGNDPTDAWFDRTTVSYRMGERPPAATYFVYGEPTLPGVTEVRVFGDGFDHSVAVDPATGGYAVPIPELGRGVSGPFATVEFIDSAGSVVGTRVLSEK